MAEFTPCSKSTNVSLPQSDFPNIFARDDFAGATDQQEEKLEWLWFETNDPAVSGKQAGLLIQLKDAEPDNGEGRRTIHLTDRVSGELITAVFRTIPRRNSLRLHRLVLQKTACAREGAFTIRAYWRTERLVHGGGHMGDGHDRTW